MKLYLVSSRQWDGNGDAWLVKPLRSQHPSFSITTHTSRLHHTLMYFIFEVFITKSFRIKHVVSDDYWNNEISETREIKILTYNIFFITRQTNKSVYLFVFFVNFIYLITI